MNQQHGTSFAASSSNTLAEKDRGAGVTSPNQASFAEGTVLVGSPEQMLPGIKRELACFIGLTFVLTWALAAYGWFHNGLKSGVLPLAMLLPMSVALFVQRFVAHRPAFRGGELGIRWGRSRYWVLAPAVILLFWSVAFLLDIALHPDLLASKLEIAAAVRGLRNVPAPAMSVGGKLALAYLMTVFVAPLLNLPIFLGEEIGWRGFMTPRLVALYGRPGLLVAGAVWAAWHLPFIAMGLNYPTHPVLGLGAWLVFCIEFGIVLQTIVVRSGSVFPAALAHGVTNQVTMLTLSIFFVERRFNDLIDMPAGLIVVALLAVPAVYAYRTFPVHRGSASVARRVE